MSQQEDFEYLISFMLLLNLKKLFVMYKHNGPSRFFFGFLVWFFDLVLVILFVCEFEGGLICLVFIMQKGCICLCRSFA